MQRRELIVALGCLAIVRPAGARAQRSAPLRRIGFLGNSTADLEANLVGPFVEGLRELGYVDGETIHIEYRWAEGDYGRLESLAGELLDAGAEILVTAGTPATLAVQKSTGTVPIVMIAVGDPVGTGIVSSLSRPGGNITGLTSISPELDGKRLELLREVVPDVAHIAVLWNSASPLQVIAEKATRAAAEDLGLKMLSLGVQSREKIEAAFATIVSEDPDALLVLADRLFLHHRAPIMDFAVRQRLPGVHAYRELVEAGGLMSYGPDYGEMHRRAAWYVDRVLRGAEPAELPVEGPAEFELVVNLKTAKTLGLSLPPAVLARATEIIE